VLLAVPHVSTAQRLGAAPAKLETPYQSEQAWALREIAADINEIARYRARPAAPAGVIDNVAPWHPELLTAYAACQLAGAPTVKRDDNDPPDQHPAFLDLTASAILTANAVVSEALARDMRNPRAHEAAALVLGAFGLRESADTLSDTRWVMNRMTAHLAVAQALRGEAAMSRDGQLATATLLALANRQKSAMTILDALAPQTPALAAWQRALRVRITQDWRTVSSPATQSRLEKLEYFRARRYTLRNRGGGELTDLREPVAIDFGRLVLARPMGVEDGTQFVNVSLMGEVAELSSTYRQLHQRELPADLPAAIINARAGRLLAQGAPQVVPWGAWAEFGQRHIGMSIQKIDDHYRRMLGLPQRADEFKRDFDGLLGHLTLYPVASTGRTKGLKGTEADLSQIARAIDVGVRAPELLTFHFWNFIELGGKYEPVAREMAPKAGWFMPLSAAVPYDAAARADVMLGPLAPPELEALVDEAPFNIGLLSRVARRVFMMQPLMTKLRALIAPRAAYDIWAIDAAIGMAREPADRITLRRSACALVASECLDLAWEMIATDEAGAAAEYEKPFRDPALDQVTISNSSGWLVAYYERTGQMVKAMDLAERSAAVGSARGMNTLARLLERRARVAEADAMLTRMVARYPSSKPDLTAFLYRQAITGNKPAYAARWKAAEREIFPEGLQPMPAAMPAQPARGVFVEQDSYWSKRVRLQAGDIIVGVDGWKVENMNQYQTLIALLPSEAVHKFTAWRGVLFTVELRANHGMTLKSHPLTGWIE
jgi:hypothetical protein